MSGRARDPAVVDGHNDVLLAAARDGREILGRSEEGHLDLPRALEGGLAGGLFAAFVPNGAAEGGDFEVDLASGEYPPAIPREGAARETLAMLARLREWAAETDRFRIVESAADLRACVESAGGSEGKPDSEGGDSGDRRVVGAVPHVEGAACVAPDLSNLDELEDAGVRSLGLVWSRPNDFGRGVPFLHDASPDTGPGLTEAGCELVRACDDRSLLVDCAHLNERGFWDVHDCSSSPLVVSHSAAHALCPATRNLTDEQLDAVADSGGVVGLTFAVPHLRPDGARDPDTPLSVLCDHVDHLVDRMGVRHVALGSDFDGATVPDALGDAAGLPRLFDALRERSYGDRDLRRIAHGNWLRVLDDTWA